MEVAIVNISMNVWTYCEIIFNQFNIVWSFCELTLCYKGRWIICDVCERSEIDTGAQAVGLNMSLVIIVLFLKTDTLLMALRQMSRTELDRSAIHIEQI